MKLIEFLKLKYWDYKNPFEKLPFGITVFCSDVGAGKTISAVELMLQAKRQGIKVYSNIEVFFQDGKISSIRDIIGLPKNSIILIDEINLILNSRAWAKTDPQLLYLMTQHRKSGKKIVTTAQSFSHVDKQVRDFCTEIVLVSNILDRWIFQRAYKRDDFKIIDNKLETELRELQNKRRVLWRYNFIASNELRAMYNSFEIANFFDQEAKIKD